MWVASLLGNLGLSVMLFPYFFQWNIIFDRLNAIGGKGGGEESYDKLIKEFGTFIEMENAT